MAGESQAAAVQLLLLKSFMAAVAKQTGIDAGQLAKDISDSLLASELTAEKLGIEPSIVKAARVLARAVFPAIASDG